MDGNPLRLSWPNLTASPYHLFSQCTSARHLCLYRRNTPQPFVRGLRQLDQITPEDIFLTSAGTAG